MRKCYIAFKYIEEMKSIFKGDAPPRTTAGHFGSGSVVALGKDVLWPCSEGQRIFEATILLKGTNSIDLGQPEVAPRRLGIVHSAAPATASSSAGFTKVSKTVLAEGDQPGKVPLPLWATPVSLEDSWPLELVLKGSLSRPIAEGLVGLRETPNNLATGIRIIVRISKSKALDTSNRKMRCTFTTV